MSKDLQHKLGSISNANLGNGSGARAAIEQVWAAVLQRKDIPSDANFFDLGGDSLKALEVISRLQALVNVELPLIAFFEDPTIAHLARIVDELRAESHLSQGPQNVPTTHAVVAAIWGEVLQRESVGISENFFDLGGDSLKALEVISRVQAELGVELPLIAFFEEPTVAHCAAVVDELRPKTGSPQAAAASSPTGPVPASFPQLTFWLLQQSDPAGFLYNEPRVIRIRGQLRPDVLQKALDYLGRRHESLRTRLVAQGEEPVQLIDPEPSAKLVLDDLSDLPLPQAEKRAMEIASHETRCAFDLENEVPIRARLLKLDGENYVLVVVIHHVLSDGHTCAIFFNELSDAYGALLANDEPRLPKPVPQYREFAAQQRSQMDGQRLEEELDYWRSQLSGAPPRVDLPTDKLSTRTREHEGAGRSTVLPIEAVEKLKSLAQANGTTLFTVLSAGLRILLSRWAQQDDLVLGTVATNRSWAGTEHMLGCFLNFLPLRNRVSAVESALDVMVREKRVLQDAFAHQCPFPKVAAAVRSQRDAKSSPVYNVALLLQNFPEMKLSGESFTAEFLEQEVETALLDLRFITQEVASGLRIDCDFKTGLFEPETISALLEGYVSILSEVVADPARPIRQLSIPKRLSDQAETSRWRNCKHTIAIASTFTAEPIADTLAFWMKELGIRSEITFAAYNQVFQQLLDPTSLMSRNRDGFNILLLRLSDWLRFEDSGTEAEKRGKVEQLLSEFTAAVHGLRATAPCIICFSPPEQKYGADPAWNSFWQDCESRLVAGLSSAANVHVITSRQLLDCYPVDGFEDEYADSLGHIPYTREFFAAIATMLARRISALRSAPKKVIALDCDNTLWKGVCAEDGATGVCIDAPRKALQEFMLQQVKAGMLLCLCSKNAEEDVDSVFAQNSAMLLHPEHITARRINWNSKSQNLRELANALQLGLDSFVFIDDNFIECAEVQAHCPEVLTLPLPQHEDDIPSFLANVWALDHWRVTAEDAQRTAMYRQEAGRDELRKQSATLEDFLASLELKLEIQPMHAADLPRVSQLTERTNQFNFTTIRRSEADVRSFLERGGECLTVRLSDRFGDYGLVGVMLYTISGHALQVDTMLLSCRALGRKVEHHMLARLGEIARERRLPQVSVTLIPTKKNRPAADFLQSVAGQFQSAVPEGLQYQIPSEYAAQAHQQAVMSAAADEPQEAAAVVSSRFASDLAEQNTRTSRIASDLNTIEKILRAVDLERISRVTNATFVAPRTPVEEILAGLWAQVLKVDRLGIHDNFFALGGHSLLATQVVARLRQMLGIELPLRAMFEAPTVAEFAKKISTLGGQRKLPPITKLQERKNLLLSFAQQRLWFLDQLDPGNSLYNMAQMMRLRGKLDVDSLRRALNEMAARHEALRTTFRAQDGGPVQVIADELNFELPVTDLSSLGNGRREEELQRLAQEEAQLPFDLAVGPLLRAQLLRVAQEDHVLLLTMHHIVSDRWTLGLVAEELTAQYRALTEKRAANVPELKVQYADFAVWQRNWLQGDVLREQLDYWKKQLAGAPEALQLPTDHARPAQMSMRGALYSHVLPRDLVRKLEVLSQQEGVTLFMTLLAAFQVLLARYSGQEDVVVGSPIAGRNLAEIEPLIGFFVNTLALRGDVSGERSFRQLLQRTKEVCLQAYAAQDIPFEKLVEELQPERSLSRNPIFQVLFALQNAPMQTLQLPGLELERTAVHPGTSILDMSWFAIEVPDGLLLRVEYSTEIFEHSTIAGAVEHFRTLLQSVVDHPEQQISKLKLLTGDEQQKLLVHFNATEADFPADLCLHTFFELSANRTPDATALICGNERLSYADLNARANQVANYLIQLGAKPEVLVGVFMERTPDLLAAILGVLKSGAAYVPIDPGYPKDRVAAILDDAKAPIVLTQHSLVSQLREMNARIVAIDSGWTQIASESRENPRVAVAPSNLAYVLFTSGSTGRPKGVAIEHHSAATLVHWAQTVYTAEELAGVLLSTSVCFDLSIFEIFVPLSVGGKLIVVQNALYLPSAEAKDEVTLINTVPSAIAELVKMQAVPSSVKVINLAGEALPQSLVEEIYSKTSAKKVFNLYGPTEDTTYSTFTLVPRGEEVTIGKPLPNTQAYVLDADRNLQPIGVPGELYLAGEGLARGYFGRDDLTAERFVANPFGDKTKKNPRMYRTGDLCRWLRNGQLEYLGRIDHQVKLRGFRIELGEIESVLLKHGSVRQALVMAREDAPGMRRLVAYVVPPEGAAINEEGLREHLKRSLPEFMLPSAFVVLSAFPLTPNGKINRKALPAPEYKPDAEAYVAPRNEAEQKIAAIYAAVLRLKQVGANDDFFRLGGHSLLATQVVSRIRQSFAVELPLRAMFEVPTVAQLAARVMSLDSRNQEEVAAITRVSRDGNLPLSFAQQRLWFLNELEPGNPLYNVPIAVGMRGQLNFVALENALNEIVRRHEILRTTFAVENNRPVQVVAPELKVKVQITDLSGTAESEQQAAVRHMAIEGAKAIFDLRTGPLFRASVLRLSASEHVLLLNMHHIVSDGWSMWQFVRELGPLYAAFVEGRPSPLPDLPIQYADYGVWQREWLRDEVLAQHLEYWTKQLEGAPGVLELPADRARPAIQTYRGTTEKVVLPLELLTRLKQLSTTEGATLFMTLLAAYQALLFRYTGQEDVVVGTPIANRTRAEIEELIGFFVNTLVMRTSVSGEPTFRKLLQRVRAVALGAYAHQNLPFEKLVEVLQPERDLTRTPVFQIWFALQNAPRMEFNLPGLQMQLLDVHNGTSKFDLGLFTVEKPDGLHCMVEYSTDLFDRPTIQRFIEHFRIFLEGIAADPDQEISEIPMLAQKEREQVLVGWNQATLEPCAIASLHQFFEEQVTKTPDDPALVCGADRLTYRELNERANQIAHRLIKLGAKPEVLVGVFLERTTNLLPSILGVLKTGAAYVPLDPMYPRERLAAILQDAKAPIAVTQQSLAAQLEDTAARVICVDADESLAQESRINPSVAVTRENLAYVLFTSGSTGRPKGVALEHRSAVTFVQWAQTVFSKQELAGVLLATSVCFDLSIFEMFVPLSVGGKVIVVQNALYLPSAEARDEVTLINTVPSAMAELVRMKAVPASVKTVNLAGEALPETLVNEIYSSTSVEKVYNLYGPTEDTTYSTYTLTQPGQKVTIGLPLPNTQAYVLDPEGNPQPIGVPGELFLAGDGLARGYFGRPDLTRERFVRNPFGPPGSRMYKTGDLCRWLPNGNLEYLGRLDHQIKLRGFRIELGEIESVLDSHQSVRKTLVMAREDQPGQKQLVAYVVPKSDLQPAEKTESSDSLTAERLSQWAATFDEAYRQGGTGQEATFNIAGWNSSYDGKPIPPEQMRVWVETTVERILDLRPKRVWEIGCGTGLLLFRIAPHVEFFRGTDVSPAAIEFLDQQIRRPELQLPNVELACKAAHEFDGVREKFDTIVINSVIQYFPNLEYLMSVITGALEKLRPGGALFIGDVRSFPLLEMFHSSIQIHQAHGSLGCAELQERIRKSMQREGELLVDPEFFTTLHTRLPRISDVEIQLKRGRAHNELTRFRYDVALHVESTTAAADCKWLDWGRESLSLNALRKRLSAGPDILAIAAVPNARLANDVAALSLLKHGPAPGSVAELRAHVTNEQRASLEPEDFWLIAAEMGYTAEVRASATPSDGTFNVLFKKKGLSTVLRFPGETSAVRPPEMYATNPLRSRLLRDLVPDLRRWLGEKVPEYMLPAHFVLLDSLPLSPNGKVDRKALPAPEQGGAAERSTSTAPRTPAEEVLASIWTDVLRLEQVGVQDDFFELGGHSLNATQVVSRIREAFHVEVPLRTMFEAPTIEALAKAIAVLQRTESSGEAPPPITPASRDQELPLSFAQQRLWFLDQMDPGNALYNIPRTLRLIGSLDVEALKQALRNLVERHEILRTTYHVSGDHPFQAIGLAEALDLPIIDVSNVPEQSREAEARAVAQRDALNSFDLAAGPVFRGKLIRLAAEDHVLCLNTHHIASDGWSTGVLLNDLSELYSAALEKRTPNLPPLEIQYADYAAWQRGWLKGERLGKQLSYWRERLAGAPPVLSLPTDRPRPEVQRFGGSVYEASIPKNLTEAVRTLSRRQGVTTFMTMLGAFKTLLHFLTGQHDIVIGTDVANRTTVQTEALIGFFVNLLVLRTDLSGNPSFEELMAREREIAIGAYAHQDLPFDKLVEELRPERNLSHSPIVQVLFVQQNTPRSSASMPGLEMRRFPIEVPSKFDMAVFMSEQKNEITGTWVYSTDLFDVETIARMASNFETVLQVAIADPKMRLAELCESLAGAEKEKRGSDQKKFQQAGLERLRKVRRKAIAEV